MADFLTTADVAERLQLKPATVSDYCKAGTLPGAVKVRPGSPWRIPVTALDALAPDTTSLLAPRNARSRAQQGRKR